MSRSTTGLANHSRLRPNRAVVMGLSILLGACCSFGAFTRDVEIDAGPDSCCLETPSRTDPPEPRGPKGTRLPRIGLRLGDTATFRARAEESYFGDSGCTPEGPLAPYSTTAPARYHWYADDASALSVRAGGFVRALATGVHVLNAELDDPEVRGRALVAVVPWFDSVRVWTSRDTVRVGDTVSLFVAAYAGDSVAPGVTRASAALAIRMSQSDPFFNTIFGEKETSPVRFVVQATRPAVVEVVGGTQLRSARHLVGRDTLVIVDTAAAASS